MRGRNVFMESLVAHGVEFIFGNPGTTESPLVDSLSSYPALKYITALHEGIATGAASFYAQASGKTGVVNLHVAPGLGNGLGMLYGASKANSPSSSPLASRIPGCGSASRSWATISWPWRRR